MDRPLFPTARHSRIDGARAIRRAWPLFLPLLIGLGMAAIVAGSGAAGACSGTGITLADLPEANGALRSALG